MASPGNLNGFDGRLHTTAHCEVETCTEKHKKSNKCATWFQVSSAPRITEILGNESVQDTRSQEGALEQDNKSGDEMLAHIRR
jgi:hypothetical protein